MERAIGFWVKWAGGVERANGVRVGLGGVVECLLTGSPSDGPLKNALIWHYRVHLPLQW